MRVPRSSDWSLGLPIPSSTSHFPSRTFFLFTFNRSVLGFSFAPHRRRLEPFASLINCNRLDMTGKKEGKKVQGPPKRVFFSDEENDAPSSPALSNLGSVASRGSQSQRATASSSQSQPKPNPEGKKAPSPAQSASTPVPAAAPTPATPYCANPYAIPPTFGQFPGSPTPFGPVPQGNFPGPIGPFGNQFTMAAQFHPPSMTPMPVCPPDKMGPPAPPLPPPAILPVVNPYGVHFQPQVPATDQGPMTHQYVPRYDPPGICYQAPQMSAYMVSSLIRMSFRYRVQTSFGSQSSLTQTHGPTKWSPMGLDLTSQFTHMNHTMLAEWHR